MKTDEFGDLVNSLAAAWTDREYSKVTDFFSESLFYSDPLNYSFTDRDSLLEFFENDDDQPQSCVFHNAVFDESRQIGAAEYTYRGTNLYHGTVWIEIEDNKIKSWREYQHTSTKNWKDFWKK